MKWLIIIPLLFACSIPALAVAGCSGSSPNWTANDATSTSAQDCANETLACGDTITIPAGTATWTTEVTLTPPTGCPAFTGLNSPAVKFKGSSTCTAGCSPGTHGVGLAFTDLTNITMSVSGNPALNVPSCSSTSFVEITGLSLTMTSGGSAIVGAVNITCSHGSVGFLFDHNDIINSGGTVLVAGQYGVVEHNLYNGTADYTFLSVTGDFASLGYANWQDATNFGTNQAVIVEDNNFASGNAVMDGYFGCKATIRYNQITMLAGAGIDHGTDSGGYRSCVGVEIYNNAMTSVSSAQQNPFGIRGGVLLFHDNVMSGTFAWPSLELDYYRIGNVTDATDWGLALAAPTWTPTTVGAGSAVLNPKAAAWVTAHGYAANATVLSSGFNFLNLSGSCTSGGSAPSNSTAGGTSNDGGCNWENIAGGTAAPPGSTGTNAGFLAADNETTCSSGATCTRFLDASGGYPFRDQPCVVHSQVVYGCYQWNNSGSNQPASWWGTDASSAIQLGRDYFSSTPGGYSPYTYPDPLQGGSTSTTSGTSGVQAKGVIFN